jgi:hypothetical protein
MRQQVCQRMVATVAGHVVLSVYDCCRHVAAIASHVLPNADDCCSQRLYISRVARLLGSSKLLVVIW